MLLPLESSRAKKKLAGKHFLLHVDLQCILHALGHEWDCRISEIFIAAILVSSRNCLKATSIGKHYGKTKPLGRPIIAALTSFLRLSQVSPRSILICGIYISGSGPKPFLIQTDQQQVATMRENSLSWTDVDLLRISGYEGKLLDTTTSAIHSVLREYSGQQLSCDCRIRSPTGQPL